MSVPASPGAFCVADTFLIWCSSCRMQVIMIEMADPIDRMKQVEDRDEIRCLFERLPARYAGLLWEHYGLEIPVSVLARREGVTHQRISEILCESKRRILDRMDYLLTG